MPMILITGSATSGKTTMADELNKLGYAAYDTEENGISGWFNKKDNRLTKSPVHMTQDWHSKHAWKISRAKVEEVSKEHKAKPVIFCGIAINLEEILNLFDKIIWLTMDEQTIRDRVHLPSRKNAWGKEPYQLKFTISRNKMLEEYYKNYGAIMIDATRPLNEVLEDVLAAIRV